MQHIYYHLALQALMLLSLIGSPMLESLHILFLPLLFLCFLYIFLQIFHYLNVHVNQTFLSSFFNYNYSCCIFTVMCYAKFYIKFIIFYTFFIIYRYIRFPIFFIQSFYLIIFDISVQTPYTPLLLQHIYLQFCCITVCF